MNVWKRTIVITAVTAAAAWLAASASQATDAPRVGQPAPAFTAADMNGKSRSLADFKGKYVVLEWHNQGCPFVKKHYNGGNMQKLRNGCSACVGISDRLDRYTQHARDSPKARG